MFPHTDVDIPVCYGHLKHHIYFINLIKIAYFTCTINALYSSVIQLPTCPKSERKKNLMQMCSTNPQLHVHVEKHLRLRIDISVSNMTFSLIYKTIMKLFGNRL